MKRVLGVWLPNWPIQRLVVARPELKHQPVILFRRDPRRGQLVSACSPAARRIGVRVEMPLSEAKSLAINVSPVRPAAKQATVKPQQKISEQKNSQDKNKSDATSFTIEAHDPAADLAMLEKLAEVCDQFSPIVGLEQVEDPATIFLDVTGLDHLFGGFEKLAWQVATEFQSRGYYAHVAIANTLSAAWGVTHFARYRVQQPDQQMISAEAGTTNNRAIATNQSATEKNTTDQADSATGESTTANTSADTKNLIPLPCPVVCEVDDIAWQQLPVTALRLEPATIETLYQLGIRQIGQLLQLPRGSLAARLGDELLKRLDQMSGQIDEPIVAHQPPPEYETFQFIEFPTTHRDTIDFVVWQLTQQLCQQLSDGKRGAIRVLCKLTCENRQQLPIRIGLFQPIAVASHLMELIRMQLEQTRLPDAVQSVSLQVTLSAPLVQHQRHLFEESIQKDWQQLAQLVNRLSSRLGDESVVRPQLKSSAQPEYAVSYQKITGQQSQKSLKRASQAKQSTTNRPRKGKTNSSARQSNSSRQSTNSGNSAQLPSPFHRPLLLHPEPILLDVISIAGNAEQSANDSNANDSNTAIHSTTFSTSAHSTAAHSADQLPAAFDYCGQRYQIAHHWGPERIETGWWRAPIVLRDYYRIETDRGQRFWIFRNLKETRRWYLHGEF